MVALVKSRKYISEKKSISTLIGVGRDPYAFLLLALQNMRQLKFCRTWNSKQTDRWAPLVYLCKYHKLKYFRIPQMMQTSTGTSRQHHWRRRGTLTTTEARRDIYRRNQYVDPTSLVDSTGRYRETTPEWYRWEFWSQLNSLSSK